MRPALILTLLTAAALCAQSPAPLAKSNAAIAAKPASTGATPAASAANPVVFTAGSVKLTKSEFELMIKTLPVNLSGQIGEDTPEGRLRLAEKFGDVVVYANEAKRRKLDTKPETRLKMLFQEQSLLAGVLYQQLLQSNQPTEAVSRAWFESHKTDYDQASARHILIRFKGSIVPLKPNQEDLSEADALAKAATIRERIVKGADFAAVAKAESDDAASGTKGGDLGRFGRKEMVPEVEQVVFTLPIGEVSQPVKSQVGYHLIQVQERNSRNFTEAKDEIEKRLRIEHAQKAMREIKSSSKPILDEGYFGKPVSARKTDPPAAALSAR